MDPLDRTVSTQLIRLVRDAARRAGADPAQLSAVHGVDDATLSGELNRVPLDSLIRLWESIAHARPEPGAGVAVAASAPLGTLTTWDYLVTTGSTLAESLRAAQPYHRVVTAAGECFDLHADGDLTVGYRTTAGDPAVAAVVNEYVLAYYLRRAREATGRPVRAQRVTFGHPAPQNHSALIEAFGTDRIEFGAPDDSITFRRRRRHRTPAPRRSGPRGSAAQPRRPGAGQFPPDPRHLGILPHRADPRPGPRRPHPGHRGPPPAHQPPHLAAPTRGRGRRDEFGFDAAIDYRAGDLTGQLAVAAPEGIDVYLDSVGGEHLRVAIEAIRQHGRIALVGAIRGYNGAAAGQAPDLYRAATKEVTLRGMLVSSYFPRFGEYIGKAAGWLADGTLRTRETVYQGLEQAPAAFLGVLSGANTGKMLVRLG
ncbi:AraC family transcriptional regulator ligand-binding domain-containing protein [Nocardia sp. NPDC127526]|uniref:AraC family transcriptional regulator ligand-binding domain-containing protein n=1 Tax=Nocardia sp. NPDC127526 TaxID=3345393 RepID=UPI0036441EF2